MVNSTACVTCSRTIMLFISFNMLLNFKCLRLQEKYPRSEMPSWEGRLCGQWPPSAFGVLSPPERRRTPVWRLLKLYVLPFLEKQILLTFHSWVWFQIYQQTCQQKKQSVWIIAKHHKRHYSQVLNQPSAGPLSPVAIESLVEIFRRELYSCSPHPVQRILDKLICWINRQVCYTKWLPQLVTVRCLNAGPNEQTMCFHAISTWRYVVR